MATKEAELPTAVHKKKVALYKRRFHTFVVDVKSIRDAGRAAAQDTTGNDAFLGAHASLQNRYDKGEACYFELEEYCILNNLEEFPSSQDSELLASAKRYRDEANAMYVNIMRIAAETQTAARTANPRESTGSTVINMPIMPKLPDINLPTFSGDILDWPFFRDSFTATIHNKTELSNTSKFSYLLGLLKSNALSTIKSVPLSDANYTVAWQQLTKKYDNQRHLASAYINKFLCAKPLQRSNLNNLEHFITTVIAAVENFKALSITDREDYLLFEILVRHLDATTRQSFENAHIATTHPTYKQLKEFLETQLQQLSRASLGNSPHEKQGTSAKPNNSQRTKTTSLHTVSTPIANKENKSNSPSRPAPKCFICKQLHRMSSCEKFQSATPSQRFDMLKSWNGCRNCLRSGHKTKFCKSNSLCSKCELKHNTMLHLPKSNVAIKQDEVVASTSSQQTVALTTIGPVGQKSMLGTAIAQIKDSKGIFRQCRLVSDSGSQNSYITKAFAQKLGLTCHNGPCYVSGLNNSNVSVSEGTVMCTLKPFRSNTQFETYAQVIPVITPVLPMEPLPLDYAAHLPDVNYADPGFGVPGEIQFLLGADLFVQILDSPAGHPYLLNTVFGHVVMGPLGGSESTQLSFLTTQSLGELVNKFWETEEVGNVVIMSPEDKRCDDLFATSTYRESSGRYVVALPFCENAPQLSASPSQALSRLLALERKFEKDSNLRCHYNEFMTQYLELGHMQLTEVPPRYIIPHHAVTKGGISKFRIVFDGSSKVNGISLNDTLLKGPTLQKDIADVILRFRRYPIVFTADIRKMYRQINVCPADRPYQCILWRFDQSLPVQTYQLNTVTYGLKSSAYQALKVIQQLVIDEGHLFPQAAKVLSDDIYVDDVVTGASNISEALTLKTQLKELLAKGCFELSKWASNIPSIVEGEELALQQNISLSDSSEVSLTQVKILGLMWSSSEDHFSFTVSPPSLGLRYTKRLILSTIARIYDRLGFLAPVIFTAKWIFQGACKSKCGWDDDLPCDIESKWLGFVRHLPELGALRIPRYIGNAYSRPCYILGFCDASEIGFCASIYIRTSTVTLLTAKTKLAPIKPSTIPRLELCGAVLLARLLASIQPFLNAIKSYDVLLFTDSTVVLAWLATPPHKLKTFIAHRVVNILELTELSMWYHIKSADNPADCGSRGLYPHELPQHTLWWNGPSWVTSELSQWPIRQPDDPESCGENYNQEIKPHTTALMSVNVEHSNHFIQWSERFSNYMRLLRSWAYAFRLINKFKHKKCKPDTSQFQGDITAEELLIARNQFISLLQRYYFSDFFKSKSYSKQFAKLSVFQDDCGLLRVGGRLARSKLAYDQKHPILLPRKSHFSSILVRYYHKKYLHIGCSALRAMIQQQFWIPSLRNLCRKVKLQCLQCIRWAKQAPAPYMGNLPSSRFSEKCAFHNTAIDFAGPFIVRETARRKAPLIKVYLCLFICMTTKAIHLEICQGLSTETFIDVLEKFVARRGRPKQFLTDNGTNFVGTANHYKELMQFIDDPDTQSALKSHSAPLGINWMFNPPRSPHFGGLFEAGVKSAKNLLLRLMGNQSLTVNELSVIVAKVEGILNSRPLYPTSEDPDDLQPLTPGHFLIGGPINALPEADLEGIPTNRLNRWQLVRERTQAFWRRWREEYLQHLTIRNKWIKPQRNHEVGDIVLLKDFPHSAPYSLPYGRVVEIHPGDDGIVRVVSIKVASGSIFKRSVRNLVSLRPLLHET